MKKGVFGERVRKARLEFAARRGTDMSQVELARVMGVAQSTVHRWESSAKQPDLDTIARDC